jgi:hypothetical protein
MCHKQFKLKTLRLLFVIAGLLFVINSNSQSDNEFGVSEEVNKVEDTGHQVQVWQVLPEFVKTGLYQVSIKHAEAGKTGSFYIIAWTDTNNDGKPDKEIGRSVLLVAKNAGDWSNWQFYSDYPVLFVGNTWDQTNEKVYYKMGGSLNGYKGLSNNVFYSRSFNGVPGASTGPRYTNIKVRLINEQSNNIGVLGQEVSKGENTGHQLQVWQVLPDFVRKGKCRISIKHAVAGNKGSFYIVAWADTNNDGKPDKEIGRSELKVALNKDDWSVWEFDNQYETIFVGNTWSQTDEEIYYQVGGKLEGYVGLSNKVYYSRSFNGTPGGSTQPRYTNIKVQFQK